MYYDPILSKIIAWGSDRALALRRMRQALRAYVVLGVRTNLPYLRAVLDLPAFAEGELSTDFLSRHMPGWRGPVPTSEACALGALLSDPAWSDAARRVTAAGTTRTGAVDPWDRLHGWRLA